MADDVSYMATTRIRRLGYGFELGGTYRFPDLPFQPSVTLGFAYGSGDEDPNDNKNDEYR